MTETTDLLARLEAATEGSRELDIEIHKSLGWELAPPEAGVAWWNEDGTTYGHREIPAYSQSLDAALTLVPEGCWWSIDGASAPRTGASAVVQTADPEREFTGTVRSSSALALCIAAIKAQEAS